MKVKNKLLLMCPYISITGHVYPSYDNANILFTKSIGKSIVSFTCYCGEKNPFMAHFCVGVAFENYDLSC